MGKGNAAGRTSRVRLHELGPRLDLRIIKVEEGLCEGAVLYHAHVKKSAAEMAAQEEGVEAKQRLKDERRKQQVQQHSIICRLPGAACNPRWWCVHVPCMHVAYRCDALLRPGSASRGSCSMGWCR